MSMILIEPDVSGMSLKVRADSQQSVTATLTLTRQSPRKELGEKILVPDQHGGWGQETVGGRNRTGGTLRAARGAVDFPWQETPVLRRQTENNILWIISKLCSIKNFTTVSLQFSIQSTHFIIAHTWKLWRWNIIDNSIQCKFCKYCVSVGHICCDTRVLEHKDSHGPF